MDVFDHIDPAMGLRIVIAVAAIAVTHFVALAIGRHVLSAIKSSTRADRKQPLSAAVLKWILYAGVMMTSVVAVWNFLGFQIASVLTLASVVLFTLGMAFQGTLGDVVAGIMIVVTNMFDVGDFIDIVDQGDGRLLGTPTTGRVVDFSVFKTHLEDGATGAVTLVPNGRIFNNVVINRTRNPVHGVQLRLTVSNDTPNLRKGMRAMRDALVSTDGVLGSPPVVVEVIAVSHLGTTLGAQVTVDSDSIPITDNVNFGNVLMGVSRDALARAGVKFVQMGSSVKDGFETFRTKARSA